MPPLTGRRDENGVDIDQLFRALSHATRRRILLSLVEDDSPDGWREFETVEFVPDGPEQEISAVTLRHIHLPHLDDAGFIGWDQESERITRGASFEDIRPLLELMEDHRGELSDDRP